MLTNEEFRALPPEEQVKTVVNEMMVGRRELLDMMVDPRRDIDKECGYPPEITIQMYQEMYERNEFAARVVAVYPEESWALAPMVFETEDDEHTPFEKAFEDLFKTSQLNLWYWCRLIDELSGIGEYGVLFLGLNDGKDPSEPVDGVEISMGITPSLHITSDQRMDRVLLRNAQKKKQELTKNITDDTGFEIDRTPDPRPAEILGPQPITPKPKGNLKLLYLQAFPQISCQIKTRDMNKQSPRYMQPVMYALKFRDMQATIGSTTAVGSTDSTSISVHWTRIIHVADNRKMSSILGMPRQKVMFNRILDIRKVLGGSGEMFWKGGFPGLAFELAPGASTAEGEFDKASLRREMSRYSDGLQRYLALVGMKATQLSPQVADPSHHMAEQIQAICIALGVPRRVFLGAEEAKIASTQDMKTWNKRLGRRQNDYLTPWVIMPLIDRLIAVGALPTPSEYTVFWYDLNTITDQDKSAIALTKTQAIASYIQGNCDQIISPNSWFKYVMQMTKRELEQIKKENTEYESEESLVETLTKAAASAQVAGEGGGSPGQPRKGGSGGTHRAEVPTVDATRSQDRGGP